MNDQPKNKIYLNLVPNVNKKAGDNQPVMVAPNSPKAPEGKNWKMNVILTKKEAQATAGANKQPAFKAGGFQKKAFTSNKSFGNRNY